MRLSELNKLRLGYILTGIFLSAYLTWGLMGVREPLIARTGSNSSANDPGQRAFEDHLWVMRDAIAMYDDDEVEIARLGKDSKNAEKVRQLESDQQALITNLQRESKKVDEDALPSDVTAFLSRHASVLK